MIQQIQLIPCPYCGSTLQLTESAITRIPVPMTIDGEQFTGEIVYIECSGCHREISLMPQ